MMSSTYVTQINNERHLTIDKGTWIKEGLEVGDFVEVTIHKVERTTKSGSGSPYGS